MVTKSSGDRRGTTLADLMIPNKVVVNEETYLPEWHLIASLAAVYNLDGRNRLIVAQLCDDYLDPSGRLLGRVRDQAVYQAETKVPNGS